MANHPYARLNHTGKTNIQVMFYRLKPTLWLTGPKSVVKKKSLQVHFRAFTTLLQDRTCGILYTLPANGNTLESTKSTAETSPQQMYYFLRLFDKNFRHYLWKFKKTRGNVLLVTSMWTILALTSILAASLLTASTETACDIAESSRTSK